MKKTLVFLSCLMYTGCITAEKDDRICIDYGSYTIVVEECKPLYGAMICMDVEKTRLYCKLYDEVNDEVLLNES